MQSIAPYRLIIVCATCLLLSACAPKGLIGDPQLPYPPASSPEVGQIMHLPTGVMVSEAEMLDSVVSNRLVYVGETHDNPASHRLQLTILRALADRHPGKVALGMEMFTPAQNDALRRWVNGELSEKTFLKEVEWFKVWKDDFDYYRDILLFARERKIPVIGLNADKATVRLVGAGTLDELPESTRETIAAMDL